MLAFTTAVHRQGAAMSSQLPVRGHSWVEAAVIEAGQAGDTDPLGDDTDETDRRRNKEEGRYVYHQGSWAGRGSAAWEWDPDADYPITDHSGEITGYWVHEKRASPITKLFWTWQNINKRVYDSRIADPADDLPAGVSNTSGIDPTDL